MEKALNQGSQRVKDIQQIGKRYEMAQKKGRFKTRRRTKQIYIL